jgi:hypothetical protein
VKREDFAYYSGAANPSLEFNSDSRLASLINIEGAEPFILRVTNNKASLAKFYLSQGLLYTQGAETDGQLRTGVFPAIGGTSGTITASTTNPISIEQFIAYVQQYPTYMPLIQCTTNSANAQLTTVMFRYRQGMINDEAPIIIPMRKYARGDQYNLQFFDLKEPLYLSSQDIIIVTLAPLSTMVMNIYALASKNPRAELDFDVSMAQKLLKAA